MAHLGDEPHLTDVPIAELQQQIPEWHVKEVNGINRLERVFRLKNLAEALAFTNRVGAIAEKEDHQLLLITE